jgi:hypothetical protein
MQKEMYPYTLRRKVIYKGQFCPKGQLWLVVKGKTNGRTIEAAKMIKGGTTPQVERELANCLWLKCMERSSEKYHEKYQTPERMKKVKDYFRRYKLSWLNSSWQRTDIALWPSLKFYTHIVIDTGDNTRRRFSILALCWLKFAIVLRYTKKTQL